MAQVVKKAWLDDGDQNFKFFHTFVNQRRKHNFISSMSLLDGTVWSSPKQVHQGTVNCFHDFLLGEHYCVGADLSPVLHSVILDVDNFNLCKELTVFEVKESLMSIPKYSSLELDGFGLGFFVSCSEMVKDDLVEVVNDFFLRKSSSSILYVLFHFTYSKSARAKKVSTSSGLLAYAWFLIRSFLRFWFIG